MYRAVVRAGLGFFRLLRLRVVVVGAEHIPAGGPAVLAVSHFGYLDFALAGKVVWERHGRLVRFLVTKGAWGNPVARPLLDAMAHIPVDRRAGVGAYADALRALREGELVGVFPEGRVHTSFTLAPFKTGAVRMAAAAGVPLVPVVVWGGHRVLTKGRRFRFSHARNVPVLVHIGEPLVLGAGTDPHQGTDRLREAMEALLSSAQRAYPDRPADPSRAWWLPAHLGGAAGAPHPPTPADGSNRHERHPRDAER